MLLNIYCSCPRRNRRTQPDFFFMFKFNSLSKHAGRVLGRHKPDKKKFGNLCLTLISDTDIFVRFWFSMCDYFLVVLARAFKIGKGSSFFIYFWIPNPILYNTFTLWEIKKTGTFTTLDKNVHCVWCHKKRHISQFFKNFFCMNLLIHFSSIDPNHWFN